MSSIQVPYSITSDNRLVIQKIQWPQRCICCGAGADGSSATVYHSARAKSETITTSVSRKTTSSGYPLTWIVPVCPNCLAHQKPTRQQIGNLILGFGFLIALGVGYGLFSLGLAYDTGAIIFYVLFLVMLGLGGLQLNKWYGTYVLQQARKLMTPNCTSPWLGVHVSSTLDQIIFGFDNDAYAADFILINQL